MWAGDGGSRAEVAALERVHGEKTMDRLRFKLDGLQKRDLKRWARRARASSIAGGSAGIIAGAVVVFYAVGLGSPPEFFDFATGTGGWTITGNHAGSREPLHVPGGGGFLLAGEDTMPQAALDLALVLDTSGSIEGAMGAVKKRLQDILATLHSMLEKGQAPGYRLGLITFSEGARVLHGFQEPREEKLATIRALECAGGVRDDGDDQFEALVRLPELGWRSQADHGHPVVRAVLLVTDEPPNSGDKENTLETVGRVFEQLEAMAYPVVVNTPAEGEDPETFKLTKEAADRLVNHVGGEVLVLEDAQHLPDLLQEAVPRVLEHSDPWMWEAPKPFLQVLRNAYGRTLFFRIRQTGPGRIFRADDVVLEGAGLVLVHAMPTPGSSWTPVGVRLAPDGRWRHRGSRSPATADKLQRALEAVAGLRIRGEHRTGPDSGGLDEVTILPE